MANELLKFRKGLYANLKNLDKDPGTIYVTTDEQAMYVDLDANTRIRLGETIHFADLAAFNNFLNATEPPYDTRAFYYIDKENALLKWSADDLGEGGYNKAGHWKQINSTAALTTELNSLKTRVTNIETEQVTQNNAITANTAAIGSASTGDGSGSDDNNKKATGLHALIEANEKAIAENKAAIESNDGDIKNLQDNKLDKTSLDEYKTSVESAFKDVNDKIGTKTDAATADTAFGRIKALEDSNATKASQDDVNALKTTVYGGADLTQDTAADGSLVKKVASLETNSATKAELKTTDDKANVNATNITALSNKLGTSADAANPDTAFQRIEALEEAVGGSSGSSLSERVTTVEKILSGDGTDQGLVKDVEDLQDALGSNESGKETGIYKEIADIKTKDSQQDTSIANLEKVLNGDSTATEGSDAKLGIAGRLTAVEDQADAIDQEIGTKDSSITETTLWDAIKANKDAAAANTNAIGDANSGLTKKVNDNTASIGENQTEIVNIKTAIGSKNDETTKDTVYGAINKNAAAISGLETTLLEKIKAANGMTYKGGVSSYSDLPTAPKDNIQIGDTYVATEAFTYTVTDDQGVTTTVQVYAGDFLIAYGDEDPDDYINTNLAWTHVNTGYIDEHESKLGVTAVTEEKNGATVQTAAQVNLTSHVAGTGVYGDLGKILFNSDNLAITSTYSEATNTGNITINAIWKDF